MKIPWALDLYNSLSTKQKNRFNAFVESPYFNTNVRLTKGFRHMVLHQHQELSSLKVGIYQEMFPAVEYSDVRLRLFFSELLELLKTFLLVDRQQHNTSDKTLCLLRHLRRTQRIDYFERLASNFKMELKENIRWDPSKFLHVHQLEMEILSYESFKNRFTHFDFKDCTDYLEIATFIQRLRIHLEQLSQEAIGRPVQKDVLIDQWLSLASKEEWMQYPEIKVYRLAISIIQQPEQEQIFAEFLNLLQQYESDFDFEYGRELYVTALNYGIRKINQNRTDFFRVTLDLFQHCIERSWILDYGIMSSLTYKNIIVLCIRMQDLELAEVLLERYKPLVDQKDRNMIYQFCLAKIKKERGEHDQALYLLNTSFFKDPLIELNARVEMIKIYYENDELEWMNNQLSATRNLIKRSKKLGYHREYYINFLAMAQWLMSTFSIEASTLEKKQKEIQEDKKLIEKTWLYQMVSRLPLQRRGKMAVKR